MFGWSLTFLLIALIAGAIGFGGLAGASIWAAQLLFLVFLALSVIAAIVSLLRP